MFLAILYGVFQVFSAPNIIRATKFSDRQK